MREVERTDMGGVGVRGRSGKSEKSYTYVSIYKIMWQVRTLAQSVTKLHLWDIQEEFRER